MEQEGLVQNSARMGLYLLDGLRELQREHQVIGDVRGLGLFCGLEIVKNPETKECFPVEAQLGARLTEGFKENGLLLRGGDAMNIMPPLCITAGEIDEIISVMDRVIGQTMRELGAE
jgi:adenosylmethionine-8-amino-7-oxononanoate aminotransferase